MPDSHCVGVRALPAVTLIAVSLLAAGCGLGLDNEERLARAEQALADGDPRSAVIDAKNVLLDEPDNVVARLLLGRAALQSGDAETGEKELRRAVGLGVAQSDVAVDIARAMLLQGKFQAAIDEFGALPQAGAAAGLQDRDLRLVLGEAHLGLNRPAAARDEFQKALDIDPDFAAAQLGVVHSYMAEGNLVQSRDTLNQVLALSDDHVPAWLTSGRLYMQMNDAESAVRDYGRAAELAAAAGDAALETQGLFGMAEASLARDDLDEARRLSARLQDIAPGSVAALQTAARIAIADEDWLTAQEKLTEILRRAPNYNIARTLLGAVHLQGGNLGQAEMYLSATVADDPGNVAARRLLAETRLRLNKADEATEALRPMLEGAAPDQQSLEMAARLSLYSGDFDTAASFLEKSIESAPAGVDSRLNLAVAYLLSGRTLDAYEQLDAADVSAAGEDRFRRDALRVLTALRADGGAAALEESRALTEAWPQKSMAHLLAGALLMNADRRDDARQAFVTAKTIDPGNVSALLYLARLELAENDIPGAAGLYREILEVDAGNVSAMLALGILAARGGDPAEAASWFEKARSANSETLAPLLLLGRLHTGTGELDKAEAVARQVLAENDEAADAHNTLGLVYLGRQDGDKAKESFRRAVDLAPDNREYRLNLARAYSAGGEAESAESLLQTAGESELEHLPTGLTLAAVQAQAGNVDAALATARRLRELHPDSAMPIALEAEMVGKKGNLAQAVELYDEALAKEMNARLVRRAYMVRRLANTGDEAAPLRRFLEQRPLDASVRLLLAEDLHRRGDVAGAIDEYARVAEQAPDNFVAINNLAWLYFTEDDPRAEDAARKAYAMAPTNGSVVDTLGWILVQKNELGEGVRLLREAVSLDDRPEVRFHLAAALARSGEAGEARQILQELLEGDRDFESRDEARELLATL